MSSKAKIQIDQDLKKMTVSALKSMLTKMKIKVPKDALKADLIRLIIDARAVKSEEEEIVIGEESDSEEVVVTKKKKSPAKKAKKSPAKKAVKKKAPAKKVVSDRYSDMTLAELRAECKKRKLDLSKCKLGSKDLADVLREWDAVVKPSPTKKSVSPKKETPKKSPVKKSPAKKVAARCDAEEDFMECQEGTICSATSGKCVKDTKAARKDKAELKVDGRTIIGSLETIKNLQKILGGVIKGIKTPSPAKKVKKVVKKSPSPKKTPVKKTPTPKKTPSSARKTPSPKKTPSSAKKTPSPKKVPSPRKTPKKVSPKKTPAKSPKDIRGIEKRLADLIDESGDVKEIERLRKELQELKSRQPKTAKARPGKVEIKKQQIYDTFKECLANLK